MKGYEGMEGLIRNLFEGRMRNYIQCLEVDYCSERVETFYDIQLQVKGMKNVMESFHKYTESEKLDGENQYDAGAQHGKQDAKKGVNFLSLPPVLHLHLKRFEYDMMSGQLVKVNDRYEFPLRLNLDEFVESTGAGDENDANDQDVDIDVDANADDDVDAAVHSITSGGGGGDGGGGGSGSSSSSVVDTDVMMSNGDENHDHAPPLSARRPRSHSAARENMMMNDDGPRGNQYTLQAVLVHSGGVGSGHYWVCARIPEQPVTAKKKGTKAAGSSSGESDVTSEENSDDDNNDNDDDDDAEVNVDGIGIGGKKWQWYRFDDVNVYKESEEDAMDQYFGNGGGNQKNSGFDDKEDPLHSSYDDVEVDDTLSQNLDQLGPAIIAIDEESNAQRDKRRDEVQEQGTDNEGGDEGTDNEGRDTRMVPGDIHQPVSAVVQGDLVEQENHYDNVDGAPMEQNLSKKRKRVLNLENRPFNEGEGETKDDRLISPAPSPASASPSPSKAKRTKKGKKGKKGKASKLEAKAKKKKFYQYSVANAYMLAYIRDEDLDRVMCDTTKLPASMIQRFRAEKENEKREAKKREEAKEFCKIRVLQDKHLAKFKTSMMTNADSVTLFRPRDDLYRDFTQQTEKIHETIRSGAWGIVLPKVPLRLTLRELGPLICAATNIPPPKQLISFFTVRSTTNSPKANQFRIHNGKLLPASFPKSKNNPNQSVMDCKLSTIFKWQHTISQDGKKKKKNTTPKYRTSLRHKLHEDNMYENRIHLLPYDPNRDALPEEWPDFDFTIHVHSFDDDVIANIKMPEENVTMQVQDYHGDDAEWFIKVPKEQAVKNQISYFEEPIPAENLEDWLMEERCADEEATNIDHSDHDNVGNVSAVSEEDISEEQDAKRRKVEKGESAEQLSEQPETDASVPMVIVPGSAYSHDPTDLNTTSSYFEISHQDTLNPGSNFQGVIKYPERGRLFHFQFFEHDADDRDNCLQFQCSALVDLSWNPSQLYSFCLQIGCKKGIFPADTHVDSILLWDTYVMTNSMLIHLSEEQNVHLDTESDKKNEPSGPQLGDGEVIVMQLKPVGYDPSWVESDNENDDEGLKEHKTATMFNHFIKAQLNQATVNILPMQTTIESLPKNVTEKLTAYSTAANTDVVSAGVTEEKDDDDVMEIDGATTNKRKREDEEETDAAAPLQKNDRLKNEIKELGVMEMHRLENMSMQTSMIDIRQLLFEKLKGVDDINCITLHEERGTRDTTYANSASIPMSDIHTNTLDHHISFYRQTKNKMFDQVKSMVREKNVRNLYYEIHESSVTDLVHHGGKQVQILCSGRGSDGKILNYSKELFRNTIDSRSTIAALGEMITDSLVQVPNQAIEDADGTEDAYHNVVENGPSALRFYELLNDSKQPSASGSFISRIFGNDEQISRSLMLSKMTYHMNNNHQYNIQHQLTAPQQVWAKQENDASHRRRQDLWKPLGYTGYRYDSNNEDATHCNLYVEILDMQTEQDQAQNDHQQNHTAATVVPPAPSAPPAPPATLHNLQPPAPAPMVQPTTATVIQTTIPPIRDLQKANEIYDNLASGHTQCKPEKTYLVQVVHFNLDGQTNFDTKMYFFGSPIIIECTIEDNPISVRKKVQERWNMSDVEFDNLRLCRIDSNLCGGKNYLEVYRGELSKAEPPQRTGHQMEKGQGWYPYDDENHKWVYIGKRDCLISYLIRNETNSCVSSECQTSDSPIITLGFEHLKRRGKKTHSSNNYTNRWASRELKIGK
jgi:hypothetical protein